MSKLSPPLASARRSTAKRRQTRSTPTAETKVSALVRADTKAQQAGADLLAIITNLPIPIAIYRLDGNQQATLINRQFAKTFSYTIKDLPTMADWARLAYPDEAYRKKVFEQWDAAVRRAIDGDGNIEPGEYRVTVKDGTVRDVVISGTVIGRRTIATLRDITSRKRSEAAAQRSLQREEQLRKEAEQARKALQSQKRYLENVLDALVDPHVLLEAECNEQDCVTDLIVSYANPATCAF